LEASFDEIMCIKSRIDELKVRLKFINNKPKTQTCTKELLKTLPRYVFKADIRGFFYMAGEKL
jgi:hypothetical protein